MGALMFAFQVALSGIPNVHITAVLIILTAVFFGWRCMYSIAVFIMLEGFFWGFADGGGSATGTSGRYSASRRC